MVASVPEEVMRSMCTEGIRLDTSSASSTSLRVGAPNVVPSLTAEATASTTPGWACPRISGPHEHTQSMYSLPSTSNSFEPSPRATKMGSRPMARMARTGELTPPGISSHAR